MSFINYNALYTHNGSVHGIVGPMPKKVNVHKMVKSKLSGITSENPTKSHDVHEITTLMVDGKLFKVFYPKKCARYITYNDTTPCPSCGQHFPCRKGEVKSPEFYDHCVKECLRHRKKGETSI